MATHIVAQRGGDDEHPQVVAQLELVLTRVQLGVVRERCLVIECRAAEPDRPIAPIDSVPADMGVCQALVEVEDFAAREFVTSPTLA